MCFVNNGSTDTTLSILEAVKNSAPYKVSILDIKKEKSKVVVIRAGIRYLNSRVDVAAIQVVDIDFSMKYPELKSVFFNILEDNVGKKYPKTYGLSLLEKRILGKKGMNLFLLMAVIKSMYI